MRVPKISMLGTPRPLYRRRLPLPLKARDRVTSQACNRVLVRGECRQGASEDGRLADLGWARQPNVASASGPIISPTSIENRPPLLLLSIVFPRGICKHGQAAADPSHWEYITCPSLLLSCPLFHHHHSSSLTAASLFVVSLILSSCCSLFWSFRSLLFTHTHAPGPDSGLFVTDTL